MPFVRCARDKRGYEQVWLIHTPMRRGRPTRTSVLYWYRTPPGVRTGREAFDEDLRARLEARYPEITFNWSELAQAAVLPPVESEPWREKRQARRDARRIRGTSSGESRMDLPGESAEPPADALPDEAVAVAHESARPGEDASVPSSGGESRPSARRRRKRRRRRDGTRSADGSLDPTDRTPPSSDSPESAI